MHESKKIYVYRKITQLNDKYLKNLDDVNNYFLRNTDYNIGNNK